MADDNDNDGSDGQTVDRLKLRPRVEDWSMTDILTLDEAARLYWPHGPLTVRSLRTAVRDGTLGAKKIAGKLFTTRLAIEAMMDCGGGSPGPAGPAASTRSASEPDEDAPVDKPLHPATANLLKRLDDERKRLKPRLSRLR